MSISQYLNYHPLKKESFEVKVRYLNVLEYFSNKYQRTNVFTMAMLRNYKKYLLGDAFSKYKYYEADIRKIARDVASRKFVWHRFYTYRFILMIDCFFLIAFDDLELAKVLFEDLKKVLDSWFYNMVYGQKMIDLFDLLYYNKKSERKLDFTDYPINCWQANSYYFNLEAKKILITANMSAGKSTLINALIGKSVTQTKNDACTAKLHYIQSKAFEDGFAYENDYILELNADYFTLMDDNQHNIYNRITVGTFFRLASGINKKVCFIDTPGVNSSQDKKHRQLTEQAIEERNYDKVVYVINGENIGSNDDNQYMNYIADKVKNKKIFFVVNKLDRFKKDEDSIAESIKAIYAEVNAMGFKDFAVCPVSAYAGLLGKKALWNEELNEDEKDELSLFIRKYKKKDYDLTSFYSVNRIKKCNDIVAAEKDEVKKKYLQMLNNAGILALENILLE